MRKRMFILCFLFILTGCTKVNNPSEYINLVTECLASNKITNDVSLGYKYYVPRGVEKVHDYNYNQVFLSDNCSLYLYVDIISYYYKKTLQPAQTENEFYYKTFNYDNKKGYLKIEQQENQYLVTMVYNYSKIEVYTPKEKLNKMVTLASIILNSITYNDTVIEKVLEGNLGEFSEFTYEVKKPDGASSNFSQYLEEYVQKDEQPQEEKLPDE